MTSPFGKKARIAFYVIISVGIIVSAAWYVWPIEKERLRLKHELIMLQQGNKAREKLIASLKKRISDFENNNECKMLVARIEGQSVPNDIVFNFPIK